MDLQGKKTTGKPRMTKEQKDIAKLYLTKEITAFLLAHQDRIAKEISEKYGFNPEYIIKERQNDSDAPTSDSTTAAPDAETTDTDSTTEVS